MGASRSADYYIFYVARSGSTYLANRRCNGYATTIAPETNFVTRLLSKYSWDADVRELDAAKVCSLLFSEARAWAAGRASRDTQLGIKKGSYAPHHREIQRLHPNCRFVLLVRDPRAVLASHRASRTSDTGRPFSTGALAFARSWCQRMRTFRRIAREHADRCRLVRYENLIRDSDRTLAEVAEFLELSPVASPQSANRYRVPERYGSELHQNIDRAPQLSSIDRWRDSLSTLDRALLAELCRPFLAEYGYLRGHA